MYSSSQKEVPSSYVYSVVDSEERNPWKPGVFRRLPWLGMSAFVGALFAIGAAVAILIKSNGQPTKDWSVQPTVYLAIASALTNILTHFALSEAVNIAWWKRAIQENTKVADLHRTWDYGNSLWAAFKSGRHVNKVAVACMLVAIGPVNGPLLQRASRVTLGQLERQSSVDVNVAKLLPKGFSGYLSGRGFNVALLNPNFTKIVIAESAQSPINITSTGCTGRCVTRVLGAGFAVNCSTSTSPYSLRPAKGEVFDNSQQAMANGTRAFGTSFLWGYGSLGTIELGLQIKNDSACEGTLAIRNCTLRAATVSYPVIIDGNQSTIELSPETSIFDDDVLNITKLPDDNHVGSTTIGGFYKALAELYESTANVRFAGAVGYELRTTGAIASRYVSATSEHPRYNDCEISFTDPVNELLQAIRRLMFRSAISAASLAPSTPQTLSTTETLSLPIYTSHYTYLYLATAITLLSWLSILPVWTGWWTLGRTTSMSPIETAKAFRAPMLEGGDSNAEAEALVKEVGERGVRYGNVGGVLAMGMPGGVGEPLRGRAFGV